MNGRVGDCTVMLASGTTCQPICNAGYVVSGPSSCSLGTLTAAVCTDIIALQQNGREAVDASADASNNEDSNMKMATVVGPLAVIGVLFVAVLVVIYCRKHRRATPKRHIQDAVVEVNSVDVVVKITI